MNSQSPPRGNFPVLTEIIEQTTAAPEPIAPETPAPTAVPSPPVAAAKIPAAIAPSQMTDVDLHDIEEQITLNVLKSLQGPPDPLTEYRIRKAAADIAGSLTQVITASLREQIAEIVQDAVYRALEKELNASKLR